MSAFVSPARSTASLASCSTRTGSFRVSVQPSARRHRGPRGPTPVTQAYSIDPRNLDAYRIRTALRRSQAARKRARSPSAAAAEEAAPGDDVPEAMLPEGVHSALHSLNQAGLRAAGPHAHEDSALDSLDYESDEEDVLGLSDSLDESLTSNLPIWSLLHGRGAQLTRSD